MSIHFVSYMYVCSGKFIVTLPVEGPSQTAVVVLFKAIDEAGSRFCRSVDETWSLLPLGYWLMVATCVTSRGWWLASHVLPAMFVCYALSCLIFSGKMVRVWRKIKEYFACLANWHENRGKRDLIYVGWLNNEFMAEIPLRNFKLNCCKMFCDSLLS